MRRIAAALLIISDGLGRASAGDARDATSQSSAAAPAPEKSQDAWSMTEAGAPGPFVLFFDLGKAEVTPEAAKILDLAIEAYKPRKFPYLMIRGYTDTVGSPVANEELSAQRASAVRDYLAKHGVPRSRISSRVMGETGLMVETPDNAKLPANRRVELVFGAKPFDEPSIPRPIIEFAGAGTYEAHGKTWVRHRYTVRNWTKYPAELFVVAPKLPPCGKNPNASRSWVEVYDSTDKRLYGFCAILDPQKLQCLWFATELGSPPPRKIYIEVVDRAANKKYRSNLAKTGPANPKQLSKWTAPCEALNERIVSTG